MNVLISDNNKDYHGFIVDMLNVCEGQQINGIAVVILTETDTLTGYWNMSLHDKLTAENEIRFDTFDDFFKVNKDRYTTEGDDETAID